MKREGDHTVLTTKEARQAERSGVIGVLVVSLALAGIAWLVWNYFASHL